MPQKKPRSFTLNADRIINQLGTPVGIARAFDPKKNKKYPTLKTFNAIWDTGATNTVISEKVIKECDLKPIGIVKTYTAAGECLSEVFFINIMLPNGVGIPYLKVTKGYLPINTDVLIGMDIITQGDSAITNKNWRTTFSFRIPSIEYIEFINEKTINKEPPIKKTTPKVGRNDPCPCGSGKKFKHCHGKKF